MQSLLAEALGAWAEQFDGPYDQDLSVSGADLVDWFNTFVPGMSPLAFMTCDPRWTTYKQAADRGWQVRKGSRGTPGFLQEDRDR